MDEELLELSLIQDGKVISSGDGKLSVSPDGRLQIEVSAHELNHRPRRCLKGRTACAVFHDEAQRLRWTKRQRQTIFRLLLQRFGAMINNMPMNYWTLFLLSVSLVAFVLNLVAKVFSLNNISLLNNYVIAVFFVGIFVVGACVGVTVNNFFLAKKLKMFPTLRSYTPKWMSHCFYIIFVYVILDFLLVLSFRMQHTKVDEQSGRALLIRAVSGHMMMFYYGFFCTLVAFRRFLKDNSRLNLTR